MTFKLHETLNNEYKGVNFKYRTLKKWLEALAYLAKEKNSNKFYSEKNIQGEELSKELMEETASQLLFSCSYLSTIIDTNAKLTAPIVKSNMINWYYSIYHSAKVMITAQELKSSPETHTKTANMWDDIFAKKNLVPEPFHFDIHLLLNQKGKMSLKQ